MSTLELKLYDLLRKDLQLSDEKAMAFVESSDKVINETIEKIIQYLKERRQIISAP